jgi:hypothetical protein
MRANPCEEGEPGEDHQLLPRDGTYLGVLPRGSIGTRVPIRVPTEGMRFSSPINCIAMVKQRLPGTKTCDFSHPNCIVCGNIGTWNKNPARPPWLEESVTKNCWLDGINEKPSIKPVGPAVPSSGSRKASQKAQHSETKEP